MNVDVREKMLGIERLLDVAMLNLEQIEKVWLEEDEERNIRLSQMHYALIGLQSEVSEFLFEMGA